jgi:hypothetical protein
MILLNNIQSMLHTILFCVFLAICVGFGFFILQVTLSVVFMIAARIYALISSVFSKK